MTISIGNALRVLGISLLASAASALGGCGPIVTGETCFYDGENHNFGEEFPSTDGCNTCTCTEYGVACTDMACTTGCEWQGNFYEVGESFPAGDGCNTCSCDENGLVGCTAIWCQPECEYNGQTYPAGSQFPAGDGCNTCTCDESGFVACTTQECPQQVCSHQGYFHSPGESWLTNDGCESCDCLADGQVLCSDNGVCGSCYYAGVLYQNGQAFNALDGCNTCTCVDGFPSCTEIACACDPEKEWYREYIAGPEECQVIDFGCADPATAFENACGCGCEQPAWCPPFFDCMPPSNCDTTQIQILCPYSGIAL
ncbi:MAG: hypothetical protein IPK82_40810 [Polyangiaceae bacterium]|nr:hypothetical protein [Polyangiaceae bacterium]